MKDLAIQQIDKVRAMLERATTLPELREIVSVADAARVYAKRARWRLSTMPSVSSLALNAKRAKSSPGSRRTKEAATCAADTSRGRRLVKS